jgi:membrane protease YdiL (CAAX protease family)
MRRFIRWLPGWAEFVVVFLAAFGYFICASLWCLVADLQLSLPPGTHWRAVSSSVLTRGLVYTVAYEAAVFLLLAAFLHVRGRTILRLIGGRPRLRDLAVGLGLASIPTVFSLAVLVVAMLIEPQLYARAGAGAGAGAGAARAAAPIANHWTLAIVILASIVNPIFEEVFVCGYVVSVLSPWTGRWKALGASVAIRSLYHVYQGAYGCISVGLTGLLFGGWYVRYGRLWPLVIAHGLLDFLGLALLLSV